ncbi:hypothetical protein ABZ297_20660 [Nonomuraea sp. NPDC005983]|uniref:hypothetical protein n=1 Tax=Nonomuraea sp. NPDC005983 TaxID=3155595 RepID=UPI0033BCEB43
MTPEEETDALLGALSRGEAGGSGDPAVRLLAALRDDVLDDVSRDEVPCGGDLGEGGVGQWRSSVSMTPST